MTHRAINQPSDVFEPNQSLVPLHQQPLVAGFEPITRIDPEADDEIDLRELWSVIKRRKGTIAIIFILVSLMALLITLAMTPIYRAGVTLQIDTEEKRVVNYEVEADNQRMPIDTKDFYQTQYELLKSRNLAERVINKLGLETRFEEEKLKKPFYIDAIDSIKQTIASLFGKTNENNLETDKKLGSKPISEKFLDNVTISPVKNSRIVTVYYEDSDPEMSATVANAIADSYINMNFERRSQSTSYAKKFLEEQLIQAKSKLEEAEGKLVQYAKDKAIFNTDDKQNIVSQKLQSLSTALTDAEKERIAAESSYKQSQDSKVMTRVQDSQVIQQLKAAKAKLQADYQDKLKTYKPDYPLMQQLQGQINEIDGNIKTESSLETTTAQSTLKADYLAAKQKEDQLKVEVEKYKKELLNSQDKSIGYNTLQREVETSRTQYDDLLKRVKEVQVAGLATTNNISIVDQALVPYGIFKPNKTLNLALGMVLGLVLGTIVAFLLEFLDDRIKSTEELTKVVPVPLLGIAPSTNSKRSKQDYALMTAENPTSAVAEAFRSLRTNLMFATRAGAPKVMNITSTDAGEGKSSSAVNLATAFAQAGKTVLLVDADLRKPTLHKRFKLDNSKGLANFLVGQETLQNVTQSCFIPDVFIMTSGPLTPNPVELLSSERLGDLVNYAELPECEFDIIILDSPPILGLADALVIGNRTHATLLVAAYNQAHKRPIQAAFNRLRQARNNVIGVIMTKAKGHAGDSYYNYDYYYTYGDKKVLQKVA